MLEDAKIIDLFFARSEFAIKELDTKYGKDIDNLIVVDLSCDAQGAYYTEGAYFTITDKTNHNTYDFNYEIQEESSESMIYYVTSGSNTGLAVTSITKADDGTEIPTLIITIGKYTLNFLDS